ncbi:MAG: GNAT family protein [Bacteroidota bacterium]
MTFDNFVIRPICIEDSSNYHLFVDQNKSRLAKYFPKTLNANKDISSTTAHVVERLSLAEKKEFFTFIVLDNLQNKIVGTVFIKDLDWTIPKGELGFFIDKDYEGNGIITNAVSIISKHCFQSMGLNKVFMRIAEDNFSSRRVAEKNEFKVEGILRKDFKTSEGKLIDVMYYGLIH